MIEKRTRIQSIHWSIFVVVVLVSYLCLTLCNSMDCSLLDSSVHEILQSRILEWITIPFSRGYSQPWDWTWVSHIAVRFFTVWPFREYLYKGPNIVTVTFWSAYRFLKRQVRWSGIPISLRIFHSLLSSTVEGFGIVDKAEIDVFLELSCFFDNLRKGSTK